ncbi:SIR2 family protein [Shinella oryzae]|uniref:SIR2 family protein n=1 Tax=Shinella oryzae TaxID=2871820 RepID=A0ABY9K6I1_9HYPH|nr:SIR2 family protein [Shinella oryzae]WLS04167.1 SIR2 family protein [Shinella oryzae]
MTISITELASQIIPEQTVLFFGAGSSIPSRAPSVAQLIEAIAREFKISPDGYTLPEFSGIAEEKSKSRYRLINTIRKLFSNIRPTGGLLNLPLYSWKGIFTTNYDRLIEDSYQKREIALKVYSSDFDFGINASISPVKLFKLHGTIEKDEIDGNNSRLILTEADYDRTQQYRENLYNQFRAYLAGAHCIIIGHSLADPDIREIVNKASSINQQTLGGGRITLLMYTADEDRALLHEKRGIEVCFGGIDEFFRALAQSSDQAQRVSVDPLDPLDQEPALRTNTIDVQHSAQASASDATAIFNGWPASYSDIVAGLTFGRTVANEIDAYLDEDSSLCALLLGASGVGKTTAVRQVLLKRLKKGDYCWEHNTDTTLSPDHWRKVMFWLKDQGKVGVLFIDDAHGHLQQLNDIIDIAASSNCAHLKLIIVSARNHWYPRIKTPNLYRYGKEWQLGQLNQEEIERLLNVTENNDKLRPLVELNFSGFSKHERRRRLVERCEKDFFVCLKNIFASDNMDDIILREFASLEPPLQEVYKHVAAMETAGVRVHRQLVIRTLQIPAQGISGVLGSLSEIVHEYDVDRREGIYGWRCRHPVISSIITKFKFNDLDKTVALFERIIDNIMPTVELEIRTIRELCNIENGLPRIPDKDVQNRLLRKMMSVAPGERVPRHRLIRNLIDQGDFEKAETEIRIFQKDFGQEGPLHRYKVNLMVARAKKTPGILEEDRISLLEQAQQLAVSGIDRYQFNKNMLSAYADLGIEYYKKTGSLVFYDDAMNRMKAAEDNLGDPEVSKMISRYERRIAGRAAGVEEENDSTVAETA